jgi:hypothetical protein
LFAICKQNQAIGIIKFKVVKSIILLAKRCVRCEENLFDAVGGGSLWNLWAKQLACGKEKATNAIALVLFGRHLFVFQWGCKDGTS